MARRGRRPRTAAQQGAQRVGAGQAEALGVETVVARRRDARRVGHGTARRAALRQEIPGGLCRSRRRHGARGLRHAQGRAAEPPVVAGRGLDGQVRHAVGRHRVRAQRGQRRARVGRRLGRGRRQVGARGQGTERHGRRRRRPRRSGRQRQPGRLRAGRHRHAAGRMGARQGAEELAREAVQRGEIGQAGGRRAGRRIRVRHRAAYL